MSSIFCLDCLLTRPCWLWLWLWRLWLMDESLLNHQQIQYRLVSPLSANQRPLLLITPPLIGSLLLLCSTTSSSPPDPDLSHHLQPTLPSHTDRPIEPLSQPNHTIQPQNHDLLRPIRRQLRLCSRSHLLVRPEGCRRLQLRQVLHRERRQRGDLLVRSVSPPPRDGGHV
jgi:hypothetical protein